MAATYTRLRGKLVELVYRFCTLELLARGMLLDDTGKTILLEQNADQYGIVPVFRLTIPYSLILRLQESDSRQASAED